VGITTLLEISLVGRKVKYWQLLTGFGQRITLAVYFGQLNAKRRYRISE